MKRALIAIATVLLLAACATKPTQTAGGTSSETVFGKIVKTDGRPAPNTHVQLVPHDYDPVAGALTEDLMPGRDTTNDSGEYAFDSVEAGEYNVEAVQVTEGTRLFVTGIQIDTESGGQGDTVRVGVDTLKPTVSVIVTLPDTVV